MSPESGEVENSSVITIRISREEDMMIERFGDQYRSYMVNTSRFIPQVRLNLFTKKKTDVS